MVNGSGISGLAVVVRGGVDVMGVEVVDMSDITLFSVVVAGWMIRVEWVWN